MKIITLFYLLGAVAWFGMFIGLFYNKVDKFMVGCAYLYVIFNLITAAVK